MSADDSNKPTESEMDSQDDAARVETELAADKAELASAESHSEEELEAGHVGVERYVHAAFFLAGILASYLSGKILLSAWNSLSDWPEAVRALPFLIEYTEDERGSLTLFIGAVVGVLLILRYYRRPSVRSWAASVCGKMPRSAGSTS